MRKKIAAVAFLVVTILAISATAARPKQCPTGTHLITCGGVSFCCPNNALCVCGPN